MDDTGKKILDLELILSTKKEQVSFAEQEWLRLQKLVSAESYSVGELLKQKSELEGFIENLKTQSEDLKSNYADMSEKMKTLNESFNLTKGDMESKVSQQNEKVMALKSREDETTRMELDLSDRVIAFSKKENLLNTSMAEFDKKVDKLKEIITTF